MPERLSRRTRLRLSIMVLPIPNIMVNVPFSIGIGIIRNGAMKTKEGTGALIIVAAEKSSIRIATVDLALEQSAIDGLPFNWVSTFTTAPSVGV